jgi:phospholipid/cholesterol/gamma-HCH transport system substrate-binding protein
MMLSPQVKVGIFILGAGLLFGIGIFFIGDRKKVFSHNYEIYTEFASVNGLQAGSKVRVSGMDAGEIVGMYVPSRASQRFRLKLRIEDKLRPLVRLDSVATIETEGLVGNEFLQVNKGSDGAKECPPNGTIPSKEPLDFAVLMEQANELMKTTRGTIGSVGDNADRALQKITDVAGHADSMVASLRGDLKEITSKGNQIAQDIGEIVGGINNGRGTVGKLLKDEHLSNRVDDTVKNAQRTSANLADASGHINGMVADAQERDVIAHLDDTLRNTRAVTQQLRDTLSEFLANGESGENGARSLRDTVANARQALVNLADDTEALKHNFFLRGFFNRRGFYNLTQLTPGQYSKTKFLTRSSNLRVWLQASELFSLSSNGTEILTAPAQSALDHAMETFVPDLPNNALMIEGYATAGTRDRQYLLARRRATLVRGYLRNRFHLDPKLVGIMPLGDTPPPETKKRNWDGISLVMIRPSE